MRGRHRRHPTREAILDLVIETPGIHKSELCRRLELSWGTVSHHVSMMSRNGLLDAVRNGRELSLFPPQVAERFQTVFLALREDGSNELLALLASGKPQPLSSLSRALNCSRKVVRRQLAQLQEAGVVHRGTGHLGRFYLAPEYRDRTDLEAVIREAYSLESP